MTSQTPDAHKTFLTRIFHLPYLLLPLAPLFWSGNFILGRAVRTAIPPIGFAFWRWVLASVILISAAWPQFRRDWPVIRRHWKILCLFAFLGIAAFNMLVYSGLRFTTALNGVLMQSTMPVMIVAITYIGFREPISLLQGVGILLSLGGVVTIITQGSPQILLKLSLNTGDLLILIALACYSIYSAILRKRPPIHPLSFLTATFLSGTIMIAPFYLWEHLTQQAISLNRVTLLSVGYVAIFPSILSYLCFNRGVELVGANRAGLFFHLMPVFGSIMAMLFLGERFHSFHAIGILLILSGILLATQIKRCSPSS